MSLEQHEDQSVSVGELLKHAAAAMDARKYADVEYLCDQALEIMDREKTDHPSKVMALEYMGNALTGLERHSEAANFYKSALDVALRMYGQENQAFISLVHKLARTYESLSLLDESEALYRSASELAQRNLSQNHPLRESISEGHSYLVARMKKRKEKVGEIMDSFRPENRSTESLDNHDNIGTLAAAAAHQFAQAQPQTQHSQPHLQQFDPSLQFPTSPEFEQSPQFEAPQFAGEGGFENDASSHLDGGAAPPEIFEPTRKPKSELRDYKGLRTKSTKYNSSAESMQTIVTGCMVLVGIGLVGFIGFQLYQRFLVPPPASQAAAGVDATESQYKSIYKSLNGKIKLKFGEGDAGKMEIGSKELTAALLHDADGSTDTAFKKPLRINLSEADGALVDDAGNFYYLDSSPEVATAQAMKSVSDSLRRAYQLRNSMPLTTQAMTEAQISYKNPITGKSAAPIFHSYSGDQGWNKNNPDEKSTYEEAFEKGNMWSNEPPFAPGSVHVFFLTTDVDAQKNEFDGRAVVAIVKGADHNGAPLKVSKAKSLVIVTTPKSQRSTANLSSLPKVQADTDGALISFRKPKT